MPPVKCFLLEPTEMERLWLRRFVFSDKGQCPNHCYHNALVFLKDSLIEWVVSSGRRCIKSHGWSPDDPRWPQKCDYCDYQFQQGDERQLFGRRLYLMPDRSKTTVEDAPPGAMWYADWMSEWRAGPDGHSLMCKCPGGHDWFIDGRARNCTMPEDHEHRCWVRHGTVPNITVDKAGQTCAAGAGSIQTPNWHGFLRDGFLVE